MKKKKTFLSSIFENIGNRLSDISIFRFPVSEWLRIPYFSLPLPIITLVFRTVWSWKRKNKTAKLLYIFSVEPEIYLWKDSPTLKFVVISSPSSPPPPLLFIRKYGNFARRLYVLHNKRFWNSWWNVKILGVVIWGDYYEMRERGEGVYLLIFSSRGIKMSTVYDFKVKVNICGM